MTKLPGKIKFEYQTCPRRRSTTTYVFNSDKFLVIFKFNKKFKIDLFWLSFYSLLLASNNFNAIWTDRVSIVTTGKWVHNFDWPIQAIDESEHLWKTCDSLALSFNLLSLKNFINNQTVKAYLLRYVLEVSFF